MMKYVRVYNTCCVDAFGVSYPCRIIRAFSFYKRTVESIVFLLYLYIIVCEIAFKCFLVTLHCFISWYIVSLCVITICCSVCVVV